MVIVYTAKHLTPLGEITLAARENSLIGLWIEGQKYYGAGLLAKAEEKPGLPVFLQAASWLARYFGGDKPNPSELPLAPVGGAFRRRVWGLLCEIPYGTLVTYGDIAKEIAAGLKRESMSAQAVGGAVGHNPLSIIIPCHRVVGAGGSLTGYASGVERKFQLLQLEGADVSALFLPSYKKAP